MLVGAFNLYVVCMLPRLHLVRPKKNSQFPTTTRRRRKNLGNQKTLLPSQSTLPDQFDSPEDDPYTNEELRNLFIKKAVLSSSSNTIAIIIFSSRTGLAFARPGDLSWTALPTDIVYDIDVIFYKGQFCAVNRRGNVFACHIDSTPPNAVKIISDFKLLYQVNKYYLVEWVGKLLLVTRYFSDYDEEPFYDTRRFEVYVYDFDINEWEEIRNLGDYSLFLGFNTSAALLILHKSPFRRNCIYCTDNNVMGFFGNESEGGHDMGVFDLGDETIQSHYDGVSTSFYSPPLWIIPKSLC